MLNSPTPERLTHGDVVVNGKMAYDESHTFFERFLQAAEEEHLSNEQVSALRDFIYIFLLKLC